MPNYSVWIAITFALLFAALVLRHVVLARRPLRTDDQRLSFDDNAASSADDCAPAFRLGRLSLGEQPGDQR